LIALGRCYGKDYGEEIDWAPETCTLSQFLVEMWREIV